MIDVGVLPTFVLAVVLICLAPGPDMAYMIAVGIAGGRRAALRAASGVAIGVLVYSLAVAAGLGAVVANSPWAFTALRVIGALYLLWLSISSFRDARRGVDLAGSPGTADHWFRRGLVVNLTNPKMMLFFLAFLPQFGGSAHNPTIQFAMLGLCYMAVGYIIDAAVGLAAGTLQSRLEKSRRAAAILNYVAGAVFLLLAAATAYEVIA